MRTSDGGYTCPGCGAWIYSNRVHYCPNTAYQAGLMIQPQPIGCICPPGANKECERLDCPRKGVKIGPNT
jgi:hypothetical protein